MKAKLCGRGCGNLIVLARKAENTTWWAVLDADPVNPDKVRDATTIRIVDGIYAYRLPHMRESLDMRAVTQRDVGQAEDFPWHTIHHCGVSD
jgi:hypothetical protein